VGVVTIPKGLREAELVARLTEAEQLIEKLLLHNAMPKDNYYKAMSLLISIKELLGAKHGSETTGSKV
jgi:hypothetical protein